MIQNTTNKAFVASLLLATGFITTGCHTTYHTATPVAKGTTETSVSVSGWKAEGDKFVPLPELAFRTGLTEDSDVGVRFFVLGAAADYNHALINAEHFALSLNPEIQLTTAAGYEVESQLVPSVNLNVLVDVLKFEDAIFTLAAKPGVTFGDGAFFTPGVGALVKFRINEWLWIAPGLDLSWVDDEQLLNVHFGIYFR